MNLTEFLLARITEDEAAIRAALSGNLAGRVLAECEAKRRLVRTMQTALNQAWQDGPTRPVIEYLAQRSLSILALPYADHPDFDESWSV